MPNNVSRNAHWAIGGLGLVLALSNALWAMHTVAQRTSLMSARQATQDALALLDQAVAVLPIAARADASQAEVVRAAQRPGAANAPYEQSGYLWVDGLGLRFDLQGRLTAATAFVENTDQPEMWAASPMGPALAWSPQAVH